MNRKTVFAIFTVGLLSVSMLSIGILFIVDHEKPIINMDENPVQQETNKIKNSIKNDIAGVFSERKGIYGGGMEYYTSAPKGGMVFSRGGIFINLVPKQDITERQDIDGSVANGLGSRARDLGCVLKVTFLNSNDVCPAGLEKLPGCTNSFIGNEDTKWQTGVSEFSKIIYMDLWDGIDLTYYYKDMDLKYEFYLHPGADPNNIKISIEGNSDLSVNPDGSLVIETPIGANIVNHGLDIYYSGESDLHITGEFDILDKNTYAFDIGEYDNTRPVVIDPLIYSSFIGGTNSDNAFGVALDGSDNIYITGSTASNDFPTTTGVYSTSFKGGMYDAFVMKFSPDGSSLIYSTLIGGGNEDRGIGIAVDDLGNAYIAGSTTSPDFPTTTGANDTTYNKNIDAFVIKLDPTGKTLDYSTYVGGEGDDAPSGIEIDKDGNAYVCGHTNSTDFPTSLTAYNRTHMGIPCDACVFKLDPVGSRLLYCTIVGGIGQEGGRCLAVDKDGYAYIAGGASSQDYPTTPGAYARNHTGTSCDFFVTKLDKTGSSLIYSTYVGGSGTYNRANSIVVDDLGNVYVTGDTDSSDFPMTPGSYDTVYNGDGDLVVFELDPTGSSLVFSTYVGGSGEDHSASIVLDGAGNIYVTGITNSTDFPMTNGAYSKHIVGQKEVFVFKLGPDGKELVYSTFIGGTYDEQSTGIAITKNNDILIIGYTQSDDFPTTDNAYDTEPSGRVEVFISMFDQASEEGGSSNSPQVWWIVGIVTAVVVIALAVVMLRKDPADKDQDDTKEEEESSNQKRKKASGTKKKEPKQDKSTDPIKRKAIK